MSIHPWGDYIAVEDPPADPQDDTVGGVVLPPGVGLDAVNLGVVVGIGAAVTSLDEFDVGAVIWYPYGAALELGAKRITKFVREGSVIAWETP